jgi:hypothetical protein
MPKSFHDSRIGPWDDRSAVVVGAKQQHGQEQVVVGSSKESSGDHASRRNFMAE